MSTSAIEQTAIQMPAIQTKAAKVRAPKAPKAPSAKAIKTNVLTARPKRIADLVKAKRLDIDYFLGSDPELGIYSLDEQRIVSSIPILKRDKHQPIPLGDGIAAYADSCLIEASFPPSKTKDEFMGRLKTVFNRMQGLLGNRYRLSTQAAHTYDADQLIPLKLSDERELNPNVVGCTPSYSAWDLQVETPVEFNDGMRSGSFHLHLGHKHLTDFQTRLHAVKLMDLFVALPSVVFDHRDPTNVARRSRYGKASSHRMPSHGLEYRCISCSPLGSKPMTDLIVDLTEHAIEQLRMGRAPDIIDSVTPAEVQDAINTCNVSAAQAIIKGLSLPSDLMARIQKDYGAPDLYRSWELD